MVIIVIVIIVIVIIVIAVVVIIIKICYMEMRIVMKIKTVAILGAGAVGSYVIWGLAGLKDIRLGVIAQGERFERLKKEGCLINDEVYRPEVWTPKEAHDIGVDLLIVSLKYGALRGALDSIATAIGENTIVMSLMNGVDSEDIIADKIGMSHIVYSLIKVASHREGKGYYFNPETTIGIVFGEAAGKEDLVNGVSEQTYISERINAIDELFAASRLNYRMTDHIKEEMWSKFRLNVSNNLPQAVLGAGVGCYRDSEHMKAISDGLRHELEAIAKAKGIDFSVIDNSSARGSAVPPTARYSTLQDIDARRHTEIDMFSGTLMRMGKELGIPTPYNEYTYHIIRAIEEKNDGKFDYDNKSEELTYAR